MTIDALNGEKRYRFAGEVWDLLTLCGFHVRVYKPEWLSEDYDYLVTIQHHYEDPGSTVLVPLNANNGRTVDWLAGELLRTQRDKLYAVYSTGFAGIFGHDEPYIETIRIAKESAIMNQRFDEAANLRDIERKLQRGTY